MAPILDEESERLKREIPIERLVKGFGVELKSTGANLVGRCLFHDDRTPSLIVTPETNLWRGMGKCNIAGSTIDWVMKTQGVSSRHAVELLRADHPSLAAGEARVIRRGTTAKLASPVTLDADDQEGTDRFCYRAGLRMHQLSAPRGQYPPSWGLRWAHSAPSRRNRVS